MNSDEVLRRTKEGMIESNKVLIRELVRDLEERAIPIVVGVDGKVKKLILLNKAKAEQFEKELKKFDLNKSDFCLLEEDNGKSSEINDMVIENITLIHKKSAKLKTYNIKDNLRWIADFHHDLENKFFTN